MTLEECKTALAVTLSSLETAEHRRDAAQDTVDYYSREYARLLEELDRLKEAH